MNDSLEDDILRSLRRISRAIDLHSRQLAAKFGLTGPQLVCLRVIGRHAHVTPSALAREVSLSQATVTGIVDRLVARQLVKRSRSTRDRRTVSMVITPAGSDLILAAPSPLQEKFAQRLALLPAREQEVIRGVLATVVRMMDSEDLDVAPVLDSSLSESPDGVEVALLEPSLAASEEVDSSPIRAPESDDCAADDIVADALGVGSVGGILGN